MDPTPSAAPLPVAGDVIAGKFVLERLLGRGGMGAVFSARHLQLDQRVAIKVMLADPANEEARQRFLNEGRAAARIQSDHVVRVHDLGNELGFEYMILELLEGEDLSQVLERGVLSPQEAVGYGVQALRGLVEAHRHGIVHRDLKPSNLFLARRPDGSTTLKILDFGISKSQGVQSALGQSPGQLTSTKAMLGSPLYMSPEQLRSSKHVDARADIWAFGVILYELMTGRLPFLGESLGELFALILENEPVPPRTFAPNIPPGLEQVILRCLQKRPENRFATATELHDALLPFAAGAPSASAVAASGVAPEAAYGRPGAPGPMTPVGPLTPAGSYPAVHAMAATTGSGANVPVVKPTGLHGGATPQPGQSAAWTPPPPRSRLPVVLGGVAALVVVVVGLAGVTFARRSAARAGASDTTDASDTALAASAVAPASSGSQPSSVAAATDAPPEPVASARAAPSASAAPEVRASASSAAATAPTGGARAAATSRPSAGGRATGGTGASGGPASPSASAASAPPTPTQKPSGGGTIVLTR